MSNEGELLLCPECRSRYRKKALELLAKINEAVPPIRAMDKFGQGVRPMTRAEARERLFAEALAELKRAAIFIRTPESMHPVGVKIYDGLIKRMDDFNREFG